MSYDRNNAIPNASVTLRTTFAQFSVPFDVAEVVAVLITTKDPREPSYDAMVDLIETIDPPDVAHVSTGVYQYDTSSADFPAVGTYFDVFQFRFELGGELFSVVNSVTVTINGVPRVGYITPQDLYDEGLDETTYPATLVNRRIAFHSRMLERYTGRIFEPRAMIMDVDGTGGYELQLDQPIVSVTSVTLLDREFPPTEVFTFTMRDLTVYNRHMAGLTAPDDREDPKLGNVYFPKGRMNVRVQGTFGYTTSLGATPPEIERVVMLMVLRDKEKLALTSKRNSSLLSGLAGAIVREKTDDHEYELSTARRTAAWTAFYTGDVEIDQLLLQFRRPPMLGRNLGANIASRDLSSAQSRYGYDFFFGRSL